MHPWGVCAAWPASCISGMVLVFSLEANGPDGCERSQLMFAGPPFEHGGKWPDSESFSLRSW